MGSRFIALQPPGDSPAMAAKELCFGTVGHRAIPAKSHARPERKNSRLPAWPWTPREDFIALPPPQGSPATKCSPAENSYKTMVAMPLWMPSFHCRAPRVAAMKRSPTNTR